MKGQSTWLFLKLSEHLDWSVHSNDEVMLLSYAYKQASSMNEALKQP